MRWIRIAVLSPLLFLLCCTVSREIDGVSSGAREFGETTAYHYSSGDGTVLFVLWSGVRPSEGTASSHCSGAIERTGDHLEVEGLYETSDGKRLAWSADSPDGVAGEVVIEETSFDLMDGRLFVVTEDAGALSIQQLERDLGHSRTIDATLDGLSRVVPSVRDMIDGR